MLYIALSLSLMRPLAHERFLPSCRNTEDDASIDLEELKVLKPTPPKRLKPAAADAYLMFQVIYHAFSNYVFQ